MSLYERLYERVCGTKFATFFFRHEDELKWFKVINFLAALGHLVNGIVSITESSEAGKNISFPVYRTYVGWEELDCNATQPTYDSTSYGFRDFIITPASTEKGFSLKLLHLIVSFHWLSFFFQMLVYVFPYSKHIIEHGVNSLRFLEYSISASIMLICIAFISNIVLLPSIVGLFFMSFATMILGGIAEALFDDTLVNDYTPITNNNNNNIARGLRRIGWIAHYTGWITLLFAYGVMILDDFRLSVAESRKNDVEVPSFVTFIVYGIFAFYMVFGAVQFTQLCLKDPFMRSCRWDDDRNDKKTGKAIITPIKSSWNCLCSRCPVMNICKIGQPQSSQPLSFTFVDVCRCNKYGDGEDFDAVSVNEFVELLYVTNSLVTKSILGWVIIRNLLVDETMSGGPLPTCS